MSKDASPSRPPSRATIPVCSATQSKVDVSRTQVRPEKRGWGTFAAWATGHLAVSVIFSVASVVILSSCTLEKVSGKTGFGPEFRHSGSQNTNDVRYSVTQGITWHWDNDTTTGVSYRRRDTDEGSGDNDNRILFEVGYPIWKRDNPDRKLAERVELLEKRVQELERQASETKPQ